jgi:formamidopyrimidine-DNA glycosylase
MKNLVSKIKEILEFSIAHNGTSSEHYVTASGEQGDMQNYLQVYRKNGQPCPRCGTMLERMVVGGRGTHYCPHCQKRI